MLIIQHLSERSTQVSKENIAGVGTSFLRTLGAKSSYIFVRTPRDGVLSPFFFGLVWVSGY